MYIKFAFLIILAIIVISLIRNTMAKYKSTGTSNANVDLAYYLFKEGSISQDLKLASILPSTTKYNYTFSVANNDGTKRTDTAIEYTISLKTTTNLPLNYRLYNQEDSTQNLISSMTTSADTDGTYFRYIDAVGGNFGFTQDEHRIYNLEVEFPTTFNSSDYEGIVEYVQITINSNQKLN